MWVPRRVPLLEIVDEVGEVLAVAKMMGALDQHLVLCAAVKVYYQARLEPALILLELGINAIEVTILNVCVQGCSDSQAEVCRILMLKCKVK